MFHYLDVKSEKAEHGAKDVYVRWLITKDLGAENFAMRLFEVDVGGFTPLHEHPWEHEVFVLEGEGEVRGGEKVKRLMPGDVVFIPSNEKHQFRNVGGRKFKFICVIPYRESQS